MTPVEPAPDLPWQRQRRSGLLAIALSSLVAAALWFAICRYAPAIEGMVTVEARMGFALKCAVMAVLFTLLTGVNAVAHERLVTPAFDPLAGYENRRFRVNQRYLQNTVEQTLIFLPGLFGLAYYVADMRAVLATTVVWVLARLAFWIGYHRSAAMRAMGAPGMGLALVLLIYVAVRIGYEAAGEAGAWGVLVAYLLFEAVLFWTTRAREGGLDA